MKKSSHPISSASFLARLKSRALDAVLFSLFSILFIGGIVYALTYPSAPPQGETAGGKFATIFNNILQSGNYLTDTTGKVKLATLSDNATNVPWTGVTGKPSLISTEVDPKVGTLTAGKWCTSNGSTLSCTSDAPTTTPATSPGTVTYGGIAWQTTDTGPTTYSVAATYCNNLAPAGTWRVPSSSEMEYARVLGMTFTTNNWFWTNNIYIDYQGNLYYYSFLGGNSWYVCDAAYSTQCQNAGGVVNYDSLYVRCVKNS